MRLRETLNTAIYARFALVIATIIGCVYFAYAYSTGITGATLKSNPPGCTCHGPNPTVGVVVAISGPDTLAPGETGLYTLSISGGPAKGGGVDIAVSGGTLTPVSTSLQKLGGELTHKLPIAFSGGSLSVAFSFTAPLQEGLDTIFANGNSVNLDSNSTGDEWNYAPDKIILVRSTSGVAENARSQSNFALHQNYPNPFNPSTTIAFDVLHSSLVSLNVFDMLGHKVATLVNEQKPPGSYSERWLALGLPSGIYFYRLEAGDYGETKMMLLVK